jgi:hypothetical protein
MRVAMALTGVTSLAAIDRGILLDQTTSLTER